MKPIIRFSVFLGKGGIFGQLFLITETVKHSFYPLEASRDDSFTIEAELVGIVEFTHFEDGLTFDIDNNSFRKRRRYRKIQVVVAIYVDCGSTLISSSYNRGVYRNGKDEE